jgi:NAD(P)-dependent dehydrogenase (short-subunit alcohol dehydrogenase family)
VVGIDRREPAHDGDTWRIADCADPAQLESALADLERIDGLVNNAAVQHSALICDTTLAQWDELLDVNLRAPFHAIKLCAERLAAAAGAIVNVASVHGVATSVGTAPYAASKAGLLGLTRAAALELAPGNVRVNAVLPGATATEALQSGLSRLGDPDAERRLTERTPLGRIASPAEIAEAIAFLLEPERSSFVTGQTLVVDGGALGRLSTE